MKTSRGAGHRQHLVIFDGAREVNEVGHSMHDTAAVFA
jgi:hypothetical protein